MLTELKAEWLKEKRAANRKLLFLMPAIFIIFSFLMTRLMGNSPVGKSYLLAGGFNWYPIFLLPIFLSLLVMNSSNKEKAYHRQLYRILGIDNRKLILAKHCLVLLELATILILSSVLLVLVGLFIIGDPISIGAVSLATACLFFGSLPIVGVSFILCRYVHRSIVLALNFLLSLGAALFAPETIWWAYPWAYNLRMMAPVLGIHPNGTYLVAGSPLFDQRVIILGIGLSIGIYLLTLIIQMLLERSGHDA
ncbi:ABC transporter permease [Enterococcus saccharolyticus]|uniref:Lantibiotic ABC transporter permease n=1 Tax=Candidatus Enterococcus willemsii TaxID=1857215 RepID=A0ABQ6YWQ0_9ENTE|nr:MULTISPECIES: ABC transporter permease [Enterococcus]KAF1301453.1 lantibiotic ABC transporter permease [Enterococcus sp. CU12B]MCD5003101.1 ABC transporter permease [Enterococcus saccharolyticus]